MLRLSVAEKRAVSRTARKESAGILNRSFRDTANAIREALSSMVQSIKRQAWYLGRARSEILRDDDIPQSGLSGLLGRASVSFAIH